MRQTQTQDKETLIHKAPEPLKETMPLQVEPKGQAPTLELREKGSESSVEDAKDLQQEEEVDLLANFDDHDVYVSYFSPFYLFTCRW